MRALAIALCLLPATARAADAVVVSVGGDAPADVAESARAEVARALEADGVSVAAEAELALRVSPARLRAAASLDDARAIAFDMEARIAVAVALWMREGAAGSITVSLAAGARTFTATVEVGEAGIAGAAAAAVGDVRGQQVRAVVIEGGSATGAGAGSGAGTGAGAGAAAAGTGTGAGAGTGSAGAGPTPAYDVIGPTMLLAFGAAGIGLGVYALLDGTCDLHGASGVCLRGEDPNVPVGATLVIAGILSIGGGVVWFLTGAVVAGQQRIDVVLGPGSIGARGRF